MLVSLPLWLDSNLHKTALPATKPLHFCMSSLGQLQGRPGGT